MEWTWRRVLNYDGSRGAKISIILDVILIITFILWGFYVTNNVFGKGLDDGLAEIRCVLTNPQYHDMMWNNSGSVFSAGYNSSRFVVDKIELLKSIKNGSFHIK
jgi:hypothetical protein